MTEVVAEGGCLCGAVRYRLLGPPACSIVCHCATCRKAASAPSVGWLTVGRGRFTWLAGAPASYASSAGVTRTFCPACGSPLTWESRDTADSVDVTTVSLDDPDRYPPTRETWVQHRLAWQVPNPALAQYPKDTDAGPLAPSPAQL